MPFISLCVTKLNKYFEERVSKDITSLLLFTITSILMLLFIGTCTLGVIK